jgi:hypothetical protein
MIRAGRETQTPLSGNLRACASQIDASGHSS